MLMTAMPGFSGPEDDFYEANLTLTRAGRLEKEGDFKGALESSKKAARLLQALKQSFPDWNLLDSVQAGKCLPNPGTCGTAGAKSPRT